MGLQVISDLAMEFRVSNDAFSLVDGLFAGLELGFDEGDDLAAASQQPLSGGEDSFEGDKGAVNDDQIRSGEGSRHLVRPEVSGIDPIHDNNPGILTQPPGKLRLADVDGIDPVSPSLEKAVGKAPRGGTQVDGNVPGHLNLKMRQRLLEFVPTSADEPLGRNQFNGIGVSKQVAGFERLVAVDFDLSGQNGPLGFLAARADPVFDKMLV